MTKRAKGVVEAIVEATGAKPGDTFEIVTPQFERSKGEPGPGILHPTLDDFAAFRSMAPPQLREAGLRPWGEEPEGEPNARMVWLFPAEWYARIPAGTEVVDIFGNLETFVPGETDNGIRFGCLSFGIFERSSDGT